MRYQRKKRLPANRGAVFSVHLFSVHTVVYCRRHSYLFTKNNLKVVCTAEAYFIYNALNRLIACTQEFFRSLYPEPVHAVAQPPTETLFELAAEIIFTVAAAFRDFLQIDSLIKMVRDILVDGFSKCVLWQPALKFLQLLTKHFIAFYQNKADIICIAAGEQHLFILQKLCAKSFLFFSPHLVVYSSILSMSIPARSSVCSRLRPFSWSKEKSFTIVRLKRTRFPLLSER